MKSYKDPTFQDRVGRAAEAKQKALEALKAKPPVDPAVAAERQAARLAREAAEREKRDAKRAAEQEAKAAKIAAAQAAADEAKAKVAAIPTAAELKAARDARYAARKSRK
jgi:hypothetical protein